MQLSSSLSISKTFTTNPQFLGFLHSLSHKPIFFSSSSSSSKPRRNPNRPIVVAQNQKRQNQRNNKNIKLKGKKDNVWSIDNDLAMASSEDKPSGNKGRREKGKRLLKGKGVKGDRVLVSGAMLMEVETVLQAQEPVIIPMWNTFASSVSGYWKGVGAAFSPMNAEMEPLGVGKKGEYLYDCYTLSHIEAVPSESIGEPSQIQRKTNWVTLNPRGEIRRQDQRKGEDAYLPSKAATDMVLPDFHSFDFATSDVMEEDVMGNEPGLVFFEDGSYSRGPLDVPVDEGDDSTYFLPTTFQFEQCLVKGCHKRLRIVHTIDFNDGGADIQILRVAIYEEQWASPANFPDESDTEFDIKPFSQRKRTKPSELAGSWKVFETSATPIYGEEMTSAESNNAPYVYFCTENLKKRGLPGNPIYFREEEEFDMQDVTVLWLPGGVTAYVDIKKDGVLCIGVGWYSDEGMNQVMERDYGVDGKLKEVRWKSEVKRRWPDPLPV